MVVDLRLDKSQHLPPAMPKDIHATLKNTFFELD